MCCPAVPALRCEILLGQPQAEADCPCSICHVFIHVFTFRNTLQERVHEILRLVSSGWCHAKFISQRQEYTLLKAFVWLDVKEPYF